jgi:hypothetical protein
MVWYVALVALVNIALGYGLAVYLGAGRRHIHSRCIAADPSSYDEYDDTYNDDFSYGQNLVEERFDTAAVV